MQFVAPFAQKSSTAKGSKKKDEETHMPKAVVDALMQEYPFLRPEDFHPTVKKTKKMADPNDSDVQL